MSSIPTSTRRRSRAIVFNGVARGMRCVRERLLLGGHGHVFLRGMRQQLRGAKHCQILWGERYTTLTHTHTRNILPHTRTNTLKKHTQIQKLSSVVWPQSKLHRAEVSTQSSHLSFLLTLTHPSFTHPLIHSFLTLLLYFILRYTLHGGTSIAFLAAIFFLFSPHSLSHYLIINYFWPCSH